MTDRDDTSDKPPQETLGETMKLGTGPTMVDLKRLAEAEIKEVCRRAAEVEERAAKAVHEAIAVYSESHGDPKPAWDDLPGDHWMKESSRKMVGALARGETPESAEVQHEIWMAYRSAAGWVYGAVKDADAIPPTHPSLVPFGELPRSEQLKDALAVRVACAVLGRPAPF